MRKTTTGDSVKKFLLFLLIAFSQHLSASKEAHLKEHVIKSIENAKKGASKLPSDVLKIDGMSSSKVRHFLNNLCSLPQTRYLEVGCWKGSTFISALYGNEDTVEDAVVIDNWSQFNGPAQHFYENCATFLPNSNYRFFCEDAFSVDKEIFEKPISIYFYDGEHSEKSQELALTYFDDVLDDVFILIVDDWNSKKVRAGTYRAFEILNYKIIYSNKLPAKRNCDKKNWWNGLYVAVVKKA